MRISDWSSDVCSSDLLGDDLLCRVAQIVGRNDRQARAREDVLALLDVRALETDDERNREVHFLRRGGDALGDDVALTDAAEEEIGRPSCRESGIQSVKIHVADGSYKKQTNLTKY